MTETVNPIRGEDTDFGVLYVPATDYARLEQECERLRAGMKGDYDLDAWLEWAKEKEAILKLLARCQEKLDPHLDAVLWGEVCDVFKGKS